MKGINLFFAILLLFGLFSSSLADSTQENESTNKASFEKNLFEKYLLEIVSVSAIIAYSINFQVGRKKNNEIALACMKSVRSVFKDQFVKMGAYKQSMGDSLIKESNSRYLLYCSGRRNCNGVLVTIDLERRQDLFYLISKYFKLVNEKDTMTIEFAMSETDYKEPIVMCIVEKKNEVEILEKLEDVKNHTLIFKTSKVPKQFNLRMEVPEIEGLLLDELVVKTIREHSPSISYIHLSDKCSDDPNLGNYRLRLQLHLDSSTNESESLSRLALMSCYLVDQVADLQLRPQIKKVVEAKRLRVQESLFKASHKERQEASQKLKEEKLQKELESRQGLSKAALLKREEKQKRRQMKKRGGKTMVVR